MDNEILKLEAAEELGLLEKVKKSWMVEVVCPRNREDRFNS